MRVCVCVFRRPRYCYLRPPWRPLDSVAVALVIPVALLCLHGAPAARSNPGKAFNFISKRRTFEEHPDQFLGFRAFGCDLATPFNVSVLMLVPFVHALGAKD